MPFKCAVFNSYPWAIAGEQQMNEQEQQWKAEIHCETEKESRVALICA